MVVYGNHPVSPWWTAESPTEGQVINTKIVDLPAYIAALGRGRNLLEEKGGPKIEDEETLAFLADIERIKDEMYHGIFKLFFGAVVTVLRNAREENDDPIEALETWVRASIIDLDKKYQAG